MQRVLSTLAALRYEKLPEKEKDDRELRPNPPPTQQTGATGTLRQQTDEQARWPVALVCHSLYFHASMLVLQLHS